MEVRTRRSILAAAMVAGLCPAAAVEAASPAANPEAPRVLVERLLAEAAARYRVDPALLKAIAWQESGWQQKVVSRSGAVGVMQVTPPAGAFTGRYLLGRKLDLGRLENNIEAGARFLRYLVSRTGGDERLAVAAYYQGFASLRRSGLKASTRHYLSNVMALRERFRRSDFRPYDAKAR